MKHSTIKLRRSTGRARLRGQRRRGVAALEFALTAPILFMLFFASVEFSRVNMLRHSVDHAAYESARQGIVAGASAKDVEDSANVLLAGVSTKGAKIAVTPAVLTMNSPTITVTITVLVSENSWIASRFFTSDQLTSTCTLAREMYENVSL